MKKLKIMYVCETARFITTVGAGIFTVKLVNTLTKDMSTSKKVLYGICAVPFAAGIGSGIDYYINNIERGLGLRQENLALSEDVVEEIIGK